MPDTYGPILFKSAALPATVVPNAFVVVGSTAYVGAADGSAWTELGAGGGDGGTGATASNAVWGYVTSAGVFTGEGATVTNISAGHYRIQFDQPFASLPGVAVLPFDAAVRMSRLHTSFTQDGSEVTVRMHSTSDSNINTAFVFIAVGSGGVGGPHSVNPARRVKGRVNANGTVAAGVGFTSSLVSAGIYDLEFNPPFAVRPVVSPTAVTTGVGRVMGLRTGGTGSIVRVSVYTDSGSALSTEFEFTAEDPGLGLEATMDVEPWNEVVPAVGAHFDAAVYSSLAHRLTPDGKVSLKGLLSSIPLDTTIMTLPVGRRPPRRMLFPVVANNAFGRIDVLTTGEVRLTAGNGNYVCLDGISFFTD